MPITTTITDTNINVGDDRNLLRETYDYRSLSDLTRVYDAPD